MSTKGIWRVGFWDNTHKTAWGSSRRVAINNAVKQANTARNGKKHLVPIDVSYASVIAGRPHHGKKPTRTRSRDRMKLPKREKLHKPIRREETFYDVYEVSSRHCRPSLI